MPRWLLIALAFVLYVAIMGGLAFAYRRWVDPVAGDFYQWAGGGVAWTLLLAILIPAAVYGYWPRRPDGTMRRLRSPWD